MNGTANILRRRTISPFGGTPESGVRFDRKGGRVHLAESKA